MRLPGYPGPYFDNPGIPTEEEWGVYCPHGEKIVERPGRIVDPWPCERVGCTPERFEEEMLAAELEGGEPMMPGDRPRPETEA